MGRKSVWIEPRHDEVLSDSNTLVEASRLQNLLLLLDEKERKKEREKEKQGGGKKERRLGLGWEFVLTVRMQA